MRKKMFLMNLAMAAVLLFSVVMVAAQPTEPYPVGTVTINATQVAAGLGWTWGGGTMMFKGKTYPFKIQGLNVAAVGVATLNAKGDVYNLNCPHRPGGHLRDGHGRRRGDQRQGRPGDAQ